MDWTIVVGAAGAVLGSGLTLGGVWLSARQRERADLRAEALEQRAEWGRRLAMALCELAEGGDEARVMRGRAILTSLAESNTASEDDRELAGALLGDATVEVAPSGLDETTGDGDNESNDRTGGPR